MSVVFQDYLRTPGPQAARDEVQQKLIWNKGALAVFDTGAIIDGASTDAGNTGATTTLRGGLLLGKVTSSGKLKPFGPTNSDGTQFVYGICPFDIKMVDPDGNGQDRIVGTLIAGYVKNAAVVTTTGALTAQARQQMRGRFWFDDDYGTPPGLYFPVRGQNSQTASYTVLTSDNGSMLDNTGATGAITFTLPAIASGLVYTFVVVADQNVTISSNEGSNIIGPANAAASNIIFQTPGSRIGGVARLYTNPGATKWICELPTKAAVTVT